MSATETTEAANTSGRSITFTSAIRETAQRLGRAPSVEQVAELNDALQSLGRITEAGTVEIDVDGKALPIDAYLAGAVTRFPFAASDTGAQPAPSEYTKITTGSFTSWRRKDDGFVRITESIGAKQAADTAKEVATWANPWAAGSENRTRQTVITNTDPALAARFKTEAGA